MEKYTQRPGGAADHHVCNHVSVSGSISKLKKQSQLSACLSEAVLAQFHLYPPNITSLRPLQAQSKLGTHPTSYTDLQLAKLQVNPIITLSHYHSIWL